LKKFFLTIFLGLCFVNFIFAGNSLVEINGKRYTGKDFKTWWQFWKDKDTQFPETPDKFINWILLSDEAKAMGLDEEPSYKRKLRIFREVRSILQLRYDEVEKKININPDSLWAFYKKEFSPFYSIKILITDNKSEAFKWKKILKTKKDFDKYFNQLKKKGKAKDLGWKRPVGIPEEFKKAVFNYKKDKIYGPILYKKNYYFIMVNDKFAGSKKDYQKIHKNVAYRYKKYMEAKLTRELIDKLKKKYKIEVNWKLINRIKPFDNLSADLKDKVVIKIEDNILKAEKFKKDLEKEINLRGLRKRLSEEVIAKVKKNIVNDVISQTLTSIEALNRHYENTVMKDIYWFYKRNRLIREFENRVIIPKIKITDDELKEYYIKHKKDFTTPELVEIAVIQTHDRKLIYDAFRRIRNGENFFEVAREIQFHGARPEVRRVDNLIKELRIAIEKMREGEVSPVIKYKDWYFIVKLIKKHHKNVHKFETVKKNIKDIIFKKKFNQLENEYIKKLREKSEIKINKKEWENIKKELGRS